MAKVGSRRDGDTESSKDGKGFIQIHDCGHKRGTQDKDTPQDVKLETETQGERRIQQRMRHPCQRAEKRESKGQENRPRDIQIRSIRSLLQRQRVPGHTSICLRVEDGQEEKHGKERDVDNQRLQQRGRPEIQSNQDVRVIHARQKHAIERKDVIERDILDVGKGMEGRNVPALPGDPTINLLLLLFLFLSHSLSSTCNHHHDVLAGHGSRPNQIVGIRIDPGAVMEDELDENATPCDRQRNSSQCQQRGRQDLCGWGVPRRLCLALGDHKVGC